MPLLAVAGLSARLMAEAAARDGFEVIGLDLFGDVDTRRACLDWRAIGEPSSLRIDGARMLTALASLASRGDVIGWVAGSGFEAQPELLRRGAALLPLIGTAAPAVQRVRDPRVFFGGLASLGIAFPDVRFEAPDDLSGWLLKDAHGTGGWHVRPAAAVPRDTWPATAYLQRQVPGVPMSATLIADGAGACVLGINRQLTRRVGTLPFVFRGVVGPVPVPPAAAREIGRAASELAERFALRGLASLDLMLAGERVQVLELNPRPPASLALHAQRVAGGAMAAHVRACSGGGLPALLPATGEVRGHEVVFARRRLVWDARRAARLAARGDAHDLPQPGARFAAGDPLCSLSAAGASAQAVIARLQASRERLLREHLPSDVGAAADNPVLETT